MNNTAQHSTACDTKKRTSSDEIGGNVQEGSIVCGGITFHISNQCDRCVVIERFLETNQPNHINHISQSVMNARGFDMRNTGHNVITSSGVFGGYCVRIRFCESTTSLNTSSI